MAIVKTGKNKTVKPKALHKNADVEIFTEKAKKAAPYLIAVAGLGIVALFLYLTLKNDDEFTDNYSYEVENYDVVVSSPLIY